MGCCCACRWAALPGEGLELAMCGYTCTQVFPTRIKGRASTVLVLKPHQDCTLTKHRQLKQQGTPSTHHVSQSTPASPTQIDRGSKHANTSCPTWNLFLQARQHTRNHTQAPQLQLACQNYLTHNLHREYFCKTRRNSYYIQTDRRKHKKSNKMGR